MIIDQEESFFFVEWINEEMKIKHVEPIAGNKEAIGLDISKLDYRKDDWLRARNDSVINITPWLELVQSDSAFIVDVPVYIEGDFRGTISAGLDFTSRLNGIMQGLDNYHLEIKDDKGTIFYTYGDAADMGRFEDMAVQQEIRIEDANQSIWTMMMVPNRLFAENNILGSNFLPLVLALVMCLLLSVSFYFMQKSSAAEKRSNWSNKKLRALIDSAPIAIFVINSEGKVVDFWNDAAEQMLGWKQGEVMGKMVPHVSEDQYSDFRNLLHQTMQQGVLINEEVTRTRKDGTERQFRVNIGHLTEEDQQMLVLLEDITREKEYEQQLKKSLHEKEVLLTEIHHRVKNNLAIVVGLIELHKEGLEDSEVEHLLNETQNRIYSISGVHELLYKTENFSEIGFSEYIDKLVDRVEQTYQGNENNIDINKNTHNLSVNINQAIPLGLLLNELITNSFSHAFGKNGKGKITLSLNEEKGFINVHYSDNGSGFDAEIFEHATTLGITLIKTLLVQLNADYQINNDSGFQIDFQLEAETKTAYSHI